MAINITRRFERWVLFGIGVVYLVLALGFSAGPVFESPDEIDHYGYSRYLLHERVLPNPYELPQGEFHQPPLYYAAIAPVVWLAGDADPEPFVERSNPFFPHLFGLTGNDNKNVYLHERAERFPYQGSPLARTVHITRLVSVVFGLCTVAAAYATFTALWPDRPDRRLIGTAAVAFMPQFVYLSAHITNDILLVLLSTLALMLTVQQIRSGPSWGKALLLGLVLGVAQLVKVSAAVLVIPVGLALVVDRRFWRYLPIVAGAALLTGGWWYVRNLLLYHDLTGMRVYFDLWRDQINPDRSVSTAWWAQQMRFVYRTFWARFGYSSVAMPDVIYRFYDLLLVVSTVGVIVVLGKAARSAWSHPRPIDRAALTQAVVVVVFIVSWVLSVSYSASIAWFLNQGRFLLPGVAGLGALVGLGMSMWSPKAVRLRGALSLILALGGVASATLFGAFIPAYRPAPIHSPIERPLALRYGDAAELIGLSPAVPRGRPGEIAEITLYWRALHPTDRSLRVYLHSLDGGLVWRDSYPATGNLLSTDWGPGETWQETWHFDIPEDAEPQTAYQLVAGLYDPESEDPLPVTAGGLEAVPYVGQFAVSGPPAHDPAAYRFGGAIGLSEPQVSRDDGVLDVCLDWIALTAPAQDYHLFVHVWGPDGTLHTQYDAGLGGGRYPSSVWAAGEGVRECVSQSIEGLPPDQVELSLGLYDPATGARLPLIDDRDERLPDDALRLSIMQ